ncbi:MAG: hypothetical protein IT324_22935 [Anaerolineae bacterium]|nr:hypothetical protein [Anaerolineae bacterium]
MAAKVELLLSSLEDEIAAAEVELAEWDENSAPSGYLIELDAALRGGLAILRNEQGELSHEQQVRYGAICDRVRRLTPYLQRVFSVEYAAKLELLLGITATPI